MANNPVLDYSSQSNQGPRLVWIGGALGIGGSVIGMLLGLAGCFGFGAVFMLSAVPTLMGFVGFALTLIGANQKDIDRVENPQVLAAIVVSLWSLLGGLVLMAVWLNWPLFYK